MLNKPIVNLSAPIWCEICVDNGDRQISASQCEIIAKKLKPYVREVTICETGAIKPGQLMDILKIFEKENIVFHLRTPAIWNNPIEILEGLKQFAYLLFIDILLNGISGETHAPYSKNKNLPMVLENIHLAIIGGFFVNIITLITPTNYNELEKIVDKMNDLGARKIIFKRLMNGVGKEKDAIIKLEELIQEGWPVEFANCYPICAWYDLDKNCSAGVSRGFINSTGDILGCENSKVSFGNILKNDIKKIWNSGAAIKWRNNLNKSCLKCKALHDCFGGCKYLLNEKNIKSDPLMDNPAEIKSSINELDKNETIKLEENLVPKLLYSTRKENFGCILISRDKFISVKKNALDIINSMGQKKTLKEIQNLHGPESIKFIYELYLKNFLEFELKNQ